jgi:hypothetical protein
LGIDLSGDLVNHSSNIHEFEHLHHRSPMYSQEQLVHAQQAQS